MRASLLFSAILLLVSTVSAQQKPCACCTENHKAFNFWVGDWNVVDSTGKRIGENSIKVLEKGCILNENWKSDKGYTGKSYNYFDRSDSTWNQLWIDNSGSILKLKGKAEKDKMILSSEIKQGKTQKYYDQITWLKVSDDKVVQLWERMNISGKRIAIVFKGIYLRMEE